MAPGSVRTTAPSAERSIDPSRRQRSDAKRNVVALLEAAKTVFAGSGVDAPAKEITDLAGVGVGTLYRHFPRRSDLIVAVLQHEIDECVEAAEELETTLSPWEALMAWIQRFTDFVGTKRGLASALHSGDPAYDDLPQHLMDRLEPALQTLLARAVDGGYARDDVTAREVLMTIALICQPVRGEQPSFNQRMTQCSWRDWAEDRPDAGVDHVEGPAAEGRDRVVDPRLHELRGHAGPPREVPRGGHRARREIHSGDQGTRQGPRQGVQAEMALKMDLASAGHLAHLRHLERPQGGPAGQEAADVVELATHQDLNPTRSSHHARLSREPVLIIHNRDCG